MADLSIASQPILKKIMPHLLVLSITVLSFLFSYYRLSTLSYYKNLHCLMASFKIIVASHAMSKNYLFLICNGLFILLAKNSSKFVQNDAMNIDEILQKGITCDGLDEVTEIGEDDRKSIGYEYKCLVMEPNKENSITGEASLTLIAADEGCLEKQIEGFHDEMHGKEIITTCEASVISISTDDGCLEKEFEGFHEEMHGKGDVDGDKNEGFHEDCGENNNQEIHESGQNDYNEEKEENEVKGHMEILSTEELNKKCDDFIKRMKEEFRIGSEAQHQQLLVIVK